MKTKKKEMMSKKPVLKKVKSKQKILTPKAGASLERAVKNVQQIFKKKDTKVQTVSVSPTVKTNQHKEKPRSRVFKRFIKRRSIDRGIVYIGHIPHGFYEEQMEDYFKQFGKITRTRVARSKNTGKSRGYGYVEFYHADVAKIAAETMNNYLMCGRLLKATYIPPEKQHSRFFAGVNWSENRYPKLKNRKKATQHRNNQQTAEDHENYVKKSLSKLSTLEHKLQSKGISLKFQAVDMPQTERST